ncbi:MAG: hypothetical protein NVS3B20_01870 [Polyangiales bacterium]
MVCALNKTDGTFAPYYTFISTDFTDAVGWLAPQYGATLQFADVNGDTRADVCGRGVGGLRCALSNGFAFGPATAWSSANDFSDAAGWDASPSYYGTIRLSDINGDGYADACGRSRGGIVCALSNGGAFGNVAYVVPRDFADNVGWAAEKYGKTIQFGDLNADGHFDVCGRGIGGAQCALAP